jgi:integrase
MPQDRGGVGQAQSRTREQPDDLVFTGPSGGVLRINNWRPRVFDRACAAAGIEGLTPQDLRHTAASLAISAGANVKAVQRMLRHASASMTLDVYAGLFGDDLDAVADRLDALVPPVCPEGTVTPIRDEAAGA